MVRGLYTAYTGLVNQQKRLDVVSNNLANSATTGYKKEGCTTQSFDEVMATKVKDSSEAYVNRNIGNLTLGAKIGETYTNYDQGSFKNTGNTLDLALNGEGFFAISFTSKDGVTSTKYTRDGSFTMTKEGNLVTKDGDFVLNDGGSEIIIPTNASEITVNELGDIYADGEYVDTLSLVDFDDKNYLTKYGDNMYDTVDGYQNSDDIPTVVQGYLEMSNVNVVSEMVDMITISRTFEANQKLVNAIDDSLAKTVQLGSVK